MCGCKPRLMLASMSIIIASLLLRGMAHPELDCEGCAEPDETEFLQLRQLRQQYQQEPVTPGCGSGGSGGDAPAVEVPGLGVLRGTATQDVAYFKGIPYAKPPQRFQPPEVHGPWESPKDATKFGAACLQPDIPLSSENCLFLNVATPTSALRGGVSLPVMIWIHGGAFQNGASNDYPADALVARSSGQVVVVTLNYRLRVFGFLGSAEVKASTCDSSAGNFGIQDQRMAMAWVKDHIAAFGGASEAVTIFGESSGGESVLNHLVRPGSFPYYSKAIAESATAVPTQSMDEAEAHYQQLCADTGCPDLACLRALDANILDAKGGPNGWQPVVDGTELTAFPAELIAQGRHSKVPIIIGSNRDETASVTFGFNFTVGSEAEFDYAALHPNNNQTLVDSKNLEEVKKLYDPSVYTYPADLGGYSRWAWTLARVQTDQVLGLGHCGVRWFARKLLEGGTPALYAYSFDHSPQKDWSSILGMPGTGPGTVFAFHGVETPFAWNMQDAMTPGEESDLATIISGHWIEFSKTGNPTKQGEDKWPMFPAQGDTVLRFNVASSGGITTEQDMRKDACDYWEALSAASVQGEGFFKIMTIPSMSFEAV